MMRRPWAPGKIRLRYVGRIEKKSTNPKKLNIYLEGLSTQAIRSPYSIVKTIVKNHSSIISSDLYVVLIVSTLSSMTTITLRMTEMMSPRSKKRPRGVSASKMISCSVSRQLAITQIVLKNFRGVKKSLLLLARSVHNSAPQGQCGPSESKRE